MKTPSACVMCMWCLCGASSCRWLTNKFCRVESVHLQCWFYHVISSSATSLSSSVIVIVIWLLNCTHSWSQAEFMIWMVDNAFIPQTIELQIYELISWSLTSHLHVPIIDLHAWYNSTLWFHSPPFIFNVWIPYCIFHILILYNVWISYYDSVHLHSYSNLEFHIAIHIPYPDSLHLDSMFEFNIPYYDSVHLHSNSKFEFHIADLRCTHVEIPDWMSELELGG